MFYSEKPGKASPTRWHKYWFMAKDSFSDDVPHKFSINYTTLEIEDSEVTKAELKSELLIFKEDKALVPCKVHYKAIMSGKSLMQQLLGSNDSMVSPSMLKVTVQAKTSSNSRTKYINSLR
ncbi:hypothetical protein LIER_42525 [Lithospermum erythrorhizon]|uniref:Uncharacterized protein n=1 Tax=Lithospermum erythrorhizon TaxID=34254 RepID=A0AAV3RU71_LITER